MTQIHCISQALRAPATVSTVLREMHRVVCHINQALRDLGNNTLPLLSHQSLIVFKNIVDLHAKFNTFTHLFFFAFHFISHN